ncbi:hypothetical protein [Cerasicoccus fimbriatus]|uniref:hypothetical protein n=1 Tax=Cerasicoccus fimbriatus TaxID=3014554 RepID=UPI0022B2E968|nr:hypothetical protein [Cerasicoccus sp. TK19100]
MKVVLLSLLALMNASLLLGYDFNTSFRFLQPLGDYHLVGLLRVDDDVVAIIERDKDHARFRVSADDELDGYKVVRLALNGRESYVELERAGNAYRVGLKRVKTDDVESAHLASVEAGFINEDGSLTPQGRDHIEQNLRNLIDAALEKLDRENINTATFADLEADYQRTKATIMNAGMETLYSEFIQFRHTFEAFHELTAIAGENYSSFRFTQDTFHFSVVTRYGETVEYSVLTNNAPVVNADFDVDINATPVEITH